MVCFECSKCNETVKKPKLAKHLLSCRASFVSCIDCSKVFAWDEWEKHTTCVSEAQKYQGKLFKEKESSNKGQKKQDMWTENVQSKVGDASVPQHVRASLEKLMGFDNVPRKQKPFANFVKNSLKLWDSARINELWDVISAANAKPAAPAAPAAAAAAAAAPAKDLKWAGFKRALDEGLREAGGELPWKKLRDAVVARYVSAGQPTEKSKDGEDLVGCRALAALPETYLSHEDEVVRLR